MSRSKINGQKKKNGCPYKKKKKKISSFPMYLSLRFIRCLDLRVWLIIIYKWKEEDRKRGEKIRALSFWLGRKCREKMVGLDSFSLDLPNFSFQFGDKIGEKRGGPKIIIILSPIWSEGWKSGWIENILIFFIFVLLGVKKWRDEKSEFI